MVSILLNHSITAFGRNLMIKKATSQQRRGMIKEEASHHHPEGNNQHWSPGAAVIPTGLCSESEPRLQLMLVPLDPTHSQQTVALRI